MVSSPSLIGTIDLYCTRYQTRRRGAFAEYEKARLVSKLRHARERIRQEKGKCGGRKPHGEQRPAAVALAKRLHRASPKTGCDLA
jgi:hypothetical protein